ncbi:hypothetical protein BASA81_001327 [Batrachochytrium salamandrivorans]|nr:hypothetical protein BASA81_001327 [Batrachochytrium salamandrivorans]
MSRTTFESLAILDAEAVVGRRKRTSSYAQAVKSSLPPLATASLAWERKAEPASLTLWRESKRQRQEAPSPPPPAPAAAAVASEGLKTPSPPRVLQAAAAAPPPPAPAPTAVVEPNQYQTRQQHLASLPVEHFEKSHSKAFSRPKLFITQLTNTRTDILDKIGAVKQLFQQVHDKAGRDKLELAMQAIANRIVLVASSSLSIEKITRGDHHVALCYLTLLLCDKHSALEGDLFRDCLFRALERACPYVTPSALKWILTDPTSPPNKRALLGYVSQEEKDDDYLMRMQSLVGFYSCLLQTSGDMLQRENKLGGGGEKWENPLGGLPMAWKWVAATLNAPVLRWTRFLLQAFLVISGHELSRACPAQLRKLLRLLQSKEFLSKPPNSGGEGNLLDADRNTSFLTFCREALGDKTVKSPGRVEDGAWVDCRVLPSKAIVNVG